MHASIDVDEAKDPDIYTFDASTNHPRGWACITFQGKGGVDVMVSKDQLDTICTQWLTCRDGEMPENLRIAIAAAEDKAFPQ